MPRFTNRANLTKELKQAPISELITKAKELVQSRRYSQSTVWQYNERFNDLQRTAKLFNTEILTDDFVTYYIAEGKQKNSYLTSSSVQRKSLLNLIASSINSPPVFIYERGSEKILTELLRENFANYEQQLKKQGIKKETITSYLQTATNFLLHLDKNNINDITKVTAADVREFISGLSVKWSQRSMRIVPSQLKTYLIFAGACADAILFASFNTPRINKPVRAMSHENIEALWKYIEGGDGDLRIKAIITTLVTTGMRPVDITGLKLDDINWSNETFSFVQNKTGERMNVKLFPVMGSAIVKYITEKRPKGTGERHIFLSEKAPYRKLSPPACNAILKTALEKAGVAYAADGLHCPRAVRRSLVSRMLAKGVPVQKAAAAIGHVDEKSVGLYTELDVKKMKAICLPIPGPMEGWLQTNG